jgi:Protein of unknown function (DUF1631)
LTEDSGKLAAGVPFPGHDALFEKILNQSRSNLLAALDQAVAATDRFLYDLCEKDQSYSGSQNIENLKTLRSDTHSIQSQFIRAVNERFAAFRQHRDPASQQAVASASGLALVDINEMDDVVSMELMAEALTRSQAEGIETTGRRMSVLLGFGDQASAAMPLSEKSVAEYLRLAMANTLINAKVRAALYRNYESVMVMALPALLAGVNDILLQAGILPRLRSLPLGAKGAPKQSPVSTAAGMQEAATAMSQQYGAGTVHTASVSDMSVGQPEQALFQEICNYLNSWRPQHLPAAGPVPASPQVHAGARSASAQAPVKHALSKPEMIALLNNMQNALPESLGQALSTKDVSLSMMLKNEMLNNARSIGLQSDGVEIMREDEDAVDLVGMLFDVLMSERDFREEARSLMSRLVVPYTKAAVLDRRLFLTKSHPARKLLNALTEAIEGNQGDGPQERELLGKAENTVDRLVAEFNEDIAIFELLELELRSYLEQHQRRIELAEKRAKEAQKGQERLEKARSLASHELDSRTRNAEMPALVREFFTRYWTHHLSIIALREGEEGPSWSTAIHLADELIAILASQPANARYDRVIEKQRAIEAVLASSGVLAEASQEMVKRLAEASVQCQIGDVPQPAGTESSVLSETSLHLAFNKETLDFDQADAEFFKTLAVGTWLQLEGSNGGYSPIKLAWVSPISSRLMFVNRRGVRVLVVSVEELAQMKKQGKLIVHVQESVFEQTMDRVLNRLKADFG